MWSHYLCLITDLYGVTSSPWSALLCIVICSLSSALFCVELLAHRPQPGWCLEPLAHSLQLCSACSHQLALLITVLRGVTNFPFSALLCMESLAHPPQNGSAWTHELTLFSTALYGAINSPTSALLCMESLAHAPQHYPARRHQFTFFSSALYESTRSPSTALL